MITIPRDGKEVVFEVDTGANSVSTIFVRFECGSGLYAELLSSKLRDRLQKVIEEIRREEYDRGWKEAKAKKGPKSNWFATCFKKFGYK